MLRILLSKNSKFYKKSKFKKNKNNINTSHSCSNLSSKYTNYISSSNKKTSNSNINISLPKKEKENMKLNLNYLNEFIEDLKINKKEKNIDNKNKKESRNSKIKLIKNNSVDNIYYYSEFVNKNKLQSIHNKNENNKNKNNLINKNENSFINDLKQIFINRKKNSIYKYNIKYEHNKYLKNKLIINKINERLMQKNKNKSKSLNSSLSEINNNNISKYINIYNQNNNNIYNDYYSLIVEKNHIKNKIKNSIDNLEKNITLIKRFQEKNENGCKKIIDYNSEIINNIEKTKKKINDLNLNYYNIINNSNNYDYDNEYSDIINKNLEKYDEIITIRNYSDIINKYNKILDEIVIEYNQLNNKIKVDKNIYNRYFINLEMKYKIIEKKYKIIKKVLELFKEENK